MAQSLSKKEPFRMPTEPKPNESTYIIDSESGAEMARLMVQDRILTEGMGGLFTELPDDALVNVHDILDLACGPGGWVLDVAYEYPKINVVGIDISNQLIDYARAQARVRWLSNVSFHVMDILKPLEFDDESIDLINARFLFGVLPKAEWPKLLSECKRVLRPGGIVRLTECEMTLSNSLAFEKLSGMFTRALQLSGHSFSPDGRHVGITPMLGRLLREAGFENLRRKAHMVDASEGMEAYESCFQNYRVACKLIEPFLIKLGLTTQEEFDDIYQQMLNEMSSDGFCAVWFYLTMSGAKPE
jgi:ubiquinone/menaquinone biosynthesis C-methylase UbiE